MNLRTGQCDRGVVVGIEGLGNDDLVAVVENRGKGHLQRLAAAGGGQDISTLQLDADASVIITHCVQVDRQTARRRIGDDLLIKVLQRLKEGRGSLHIRLADVQVIDLDAAFFGLLCIGIELAHGGKTAALHFG